MLEKKRKELRRRRAEHAAKLLRLNWETEEVKRRLSAAQTRVQYLRRGNVQEWLDHTAPSHQNQEAAFEAPAQQTTSVSLPEVPIAPRPRMGDLLIQNGLITKEQLEHAFARQQDFGGRLGDILLDLKYVTAEQLLPYISNQPQKGRLGDMLLQLGYLTKEQLEKALAFQRKSGGMLGDVLLSLQFLEAEQLYRAIATQNNLGRIGNDIIFNTELKLPEPIAREYGIVVIHQYPNRYLVAVNEPLSDDNKTLLEEVLKMPIEQVLASKSEMEMFWSEVYGDEMLEESTTKLAIEQPHNSASVTFTKAQIFWIFASIIILAGGLLWDLFWTLIAVNVMVQFFYFSMTLFKFIIIMFGSRSGAQYRFSAEELNKYDERELPLYTILVPMYKESGVIPHLIRNLEKLDYPKAKLDVRLLIEKDDIEAQELLKNMKLPPYYTVLVVPDSLPKTKPKACNYGLIRARGKYVVIYDAEDRPDPDQLKKVHLTFESCSENTACVQAKLNYFNSEQNLLTRWFTQEYSMWFELLLPGIMKLDIPIPLGGTSNHFKTDVLKSLNAWDPYNVTEDADLGIRLYKEGYKTAIVDSRTWEEANSRFGNWIRQRSRWIKGYMQTWLVHMRNPLRLYRELGLRGFMGFHVMVLATPMLPLLNPLFWSMIILWYGWKADWIKQFFPGSVYYLASVEFYFANFLFVFSNAAGVYWVIHELEKRGDHFFSYGLVRSTLLTPLYWVMMSIASIKGAWQLITKPFYWEKTLHGLTEDNHVDSSTFTKTG
ncbi:glycosyltransferase family 2 protein [Cohnella silvisoli]|uniref:Glycosyltransferase family 2 protein n=2 Tax=Cohnella silvisoli TaxID=2873699 RepID=A0ABV1KYH0_9BACL|nr:glycosyltransferase family 2 protein [Cohnella silvisoli]